MDPTAPSPTLGFSSTVDAAAAAGLVHMRARDYDPVTGQFLTPDPWQRPDGQPWVGVHAYTDGDPVSFWDPSGLRPKASGCAPKRDGRGGPTGCDVELWIHRNVCEGLGRSVLSMFSYLGLGRVVTSLAKGDWDSAVDEMQAFSLSTSFTGLPKKIPGIGGRMVVPAGVLATAAEATCEAPEIKAKYGTPFPNSPSGGGGSW